MLTSLMKHMARWSSTHEKIEGALGISWTMLADVVADQFADQLRGRTAFPLRDFFEFFEGFLKIFREIEHLLDSLDKNVSSLSAENSYI